MWTGANTIVCEQCKKIFRKQPYQQKRAKYHFCSIKCKGDWQKINLRGENNPFYGKSFDPITRKMMTEKTRGYKHTDEAKKKISNAHKGSKSYRWKGGITAERQAFHSQREWIQVAKKARERDDFKCRICKESVTRKTIQVHHIISFEIKEKRLCLNNLILLCRKCHGFIHSNKNIKKRFISN